MTGEHNAQTPGCGAMGVEKTVGSGGEEDDASGGSCFRQRECCTSRSA